MFEKVKNILSIFEEINEIPPRSKNEEQISLWLQDWGKSNGFEVKTDEVMNVLIKVPATEGYENSPVIVIQGHMDMVCEKTPESPHDFSKDPIKMVYEGDWLKADRTTLGADNGIALAMGMALATDKSVKHPPLELLFTIDEETGLTGANALKPGFFEGKILLNIDSEDEGVFTVGCAGGRDTHITLPLNFEAKPQSFRTYKLKASGMFGGHSGVDIKEGRANANKVLTRALMEIFRKFYIKLISLSGGTAHNAIARDAEALIALDSANQENIKLLLAEFEKTVAAEYSVTDPDLKVTLEEVEDIENQVITEADTEKVFNLLLAFPHGVAVMSSDVEGLVETSNNMATIRMEEGKLTILSSQRSSVMSRLDEITDRVEAVGNLAGAEVKSGNGYPAWQPDMNSPILQKCKETYKMRFDREPKIEIIHAGLECGVIGSKYEGMDMVSLGPTIKNPHSPDEKLHVPSVGKVWDFLVKLLETSK